MIVSFAIVAYNEDQTLPRLLSDLKEQDYPHDKIEVLLIDSMSTDNTKRLMDEFAAEGTDFRAVRVFENTVKTLPHGCNIMLENYTGDAVVRIDAHASIPSDFITKNVAVLQSGAMVCGGNRPNIIDDTSPWKNTLLAAEQSLFGSSIASYRCSTEKREVPSVFHGMYRREVYDTVGLYDERLLRTEDNDMSCRIRRAGFTLWYDPSIVSYQHTRNSLSKMLKQKFLNGYWIGKTMGINPDCFSLFHFVPFAFVIAILFAALFVVNGIAWPAILLAAAYGTAAVAMTVPSLLRRPFLWTNLLLPFLFAALHICYGVGTLAGLLEMPFWLYKLNK